MRLMLATLCLNEEEWLDRLYKQHIDWKGNISELMWVFVEAADCQYAKSNPELVNSSGLSTDRTSQILCNLHTNDERVQYIPHGFSNSQDKAQGKCEARNRYLEIADEWKPDYILVLDADEFWTYQAQQDVIEWLKLDKHKTAFSAKHREIWFPPSLRQKYSSPYPLFKYEVVGGFWNILYCRIWKWFPGIRYISNHNTPCMPNGIPLDRNLKNHTAYERYAGSKARFPQYIHMGFASNPEKRKAKNKYYEDRGEKIDPKRSWYTESRACFDTWEPGDGPQSILPRGASVIDYIGPIPEVFKEFDENGKPFIEIGW